MVVVHVGRNRVDDLGWGDVRGEFQNALDGLGSARFGPPELPEQMSLDFLDDGVGTATSSLPSMAISRMRFGLPPNSSAGKVDVGIERDALHRPRCSAWDSAIRRGISSLIPRSSARCRP